VAATNGTGTQQPTKSATAISSTYPGVTSDGGDLLTASVGSTVGGDTVAALVMVMVGSPPAARVVAELTANASANDGGIEIDSSGSVIEAYARGTVDYSGRQATVNTTTPKVISVLFDLSIAGVGAIVAIRSNGVALSVSTLRANSVAGTIANASLRLFARSGVAAAWAGTLGNFVWLETATQGNALASVERYVGAKAGITW